MKRLAPLAACALLLSSCEGLSVADAYVAADKATFDAIAPEYEVYVRGDMNLDEPSKAARIRLLTSWKMRLEANEK